VHHAVEVVFATITTLLNANCPKVQATSYSSMAMIAWFIGCVADQNNYQLMLPDSHVVLNARRGKEPVAEPPPLLERVVAHVPLGMLFTLSPKLTVWPFATACILFSQFLFRGAGDWDAPLKPLPHARDGLEQHQPSPIHQVPLRPSSTGWSTPALSGGSAQGFDYVDQRMSREERRAKSGPEVVCRRLWEGRGDETARIRGNVGPGGRREGQKVPEYLVSNRIALALKATAAHQVWADAYPTRASSVKQLIKSFISTSGPGGTEPTAKKPTRTPFIRTEIACCVQMTMITPAIGLSEAQMWR